MAELTGAIGNLERDVKERLKELGYEKVRRRWGQGFKVIVSADKGDERIWVELENNSYETCCKGKRTSGPINDLFRDVNQKDHG